MDSRKDIPEPFWDLLDGYRAELTEQALAIVGNAQDAEDVVQETFCEAVRHPEKLAEARSLGAWLKAINRANALNKVRAKKHDSKRIDRKQLEAPARSTTTGGFSAIEINDMVSRAIAALPDDQRAAILMHYYEHKSHDEIAKHLNVSPRTVRRLLYDASLAMHAVLKPQASAADTDSPPPQPIQGDTP
jgi:RNA polymerase sigma-70 factor (ECF subfamily)